jgi:acetate kinase
MSAASAPILALNVGSSSLKFGLYRVDDEHTEVLEEKSGIDDVDEVFAQVTRLLRERYGHDAPAAVGHRVVHGGMFARDHALIDDAKYAELEAAAVFAPLHVPPALALIRKARETWPAIPHIACLDTAFHASMPEVAKTLPIPATLRREGIERYGFHGLSCESIVHQLGARLPARLIVAHLGNGASITAIRDGRSVDTSMGLTPSGGIVMGTRSGDLDPGLLVYLLREKGYDAASLADLVDHRSGLKGISGLSGDLRTLHTAATGDARLAIAMFCHSAKKQIAAMAAVLGGVDLLVFTGGIGENDEAVRTAICEGLGGLGIGPATVLPSREDGQIARIAWRLAGG